MVFVALEFSCLARYDPKHCRSHAKGAKEVPISSALSREISETRFGRFLSGSSSDTMKAGASLRSLRAWREKFWMVRPIPRAPSTRIFHAEIAKDAKTGPGPSIPSDGCNQNVPDSPQANFWEFRQNLGVLCVHCVRSALSGFNG